MPGWTFDSTVPFWLFEASEVPLVTKFPKAEDNVSEAEFKTSGKISLTALLMAICTRGATMPNMISTMNSLTIWAVLLVSRSWIGLDLSSKVPASKKILNEFFLIFLLINTC